MAKEIHKRIIWLWFERIRVYDGRAKEQQKAHILIHNRETEREH